jgi:hypothetical protein
MTFLSSNALRMCRKSRFPNVWDAEGNIGCSARRLLDYETGKLRPKPETAALIGRGLNSINYLECYCKECEVMSAIWFMRFDKSVNL